MSGNLEKRILQKRLKVTGKDPLTHTHTSPNENVKNKPRKSVIRDRFFSLLF